MKVKKANLSGYVHQSLLDNCFIQTNSGMCTTSHNDELCPRFKWDWFTLQSPAIIYEDNPTYILRMHTLYIKSYITKHIAPKLFSPHELQKNGEINSLLTKTLIYLPKSLPSSLFHKYVNEIGMM